MNKIIEFRTTLGTDGRIVMPAKCRNALHLSAGDEVIIRIKDDEATLFTLKHVLKQAQIAVSKYTKGKKNLSTLLIKERRKEVKHES